MEAHSGILMGLWAEESGRATGHEVAEVRIQLGDCAHFHVGGGVPSSD